MKPKERIRAIDIEQKAINAYNSDDDLFEGLDDPPVQPPTRRHEGVTKETMYAASDAMVGFLATLLNFSATQLLERMPEAIQYPMVRPMESIRHEVVAVNNELTDLVLDMASKVDAQTEQIQTIREQVTNIGRRLANLEATVDEMPARIIDRLEGGMLGRFMASIHSFLREQSMPEDKRTKILRTRESLGKRAYYEEPLPEPPPQEDYIEELYREAPETEANPTTESLATNPYSRFLEPLPGRRGFTPESIVRASVEAAKDFAKKTGSRRVNLRLLRQMLPFNSLTTLNNTVKKLYGEKATVTEVIERELLKSE